MPRWSERFAMYCVRNGVVHEDQLPWLIYGIEKRISSLCVSVPFFLISLVLTNPWCALSFFAAFYLLRRRTNGYHANSVSACLYISLLLEILFLRLIYQLLCGIIIFILLGICVLVIYKLAPFNHPNMNYTKDEISACRVSARVNTYILTLSAIIAYSAGLYELSKGLTLGITMTTVLLCMAYISEWRKKNE